MLFAVVFAWVLLGQALGPQQLAGAVLVLAGITLVRVDDLRTATPQPVLAPHERVVTADAPVP